MAQALEFFFDEPAEQQVRALWQRLADAGVPSLASRGQGRQRPQVTFAVASVIPSRTRALLHTELSRLALPALWLYTLGTFPTSQPGLVLGAVTDGELLAVHSAVHDALAGRVRDPSAYYLPGAWLPHCALAVDLSPAQLVAGFGALQPYEPVRARISGIGVTDTRTGETEPLG